MFTASCCRHGAQPLVLAGSRSIPVGRPWALAASLAIGTAVAIGTAAGAYADVSTPPPVNIDARVSGGGGDYSNGDFSQWPSVQTKGYNGAGIDYIPTYSASVVSDPVKGKVARFEVRPGDVPDFGGGERAECASSAEASGGTEGQTLWFAFSTKFDPNVSLDYNIWPQWAVTNQWHPDNSPGSPPFSFGLTGGGSWSLVVNPQSAPDQYIRPAYSIWNVPMNQGNWHDIKMQVHFSTSDTAGWIQLWHNGMRQTFNDGSDTYHLATIIPTTATVYYKEGLYRAPKASTDVVYHSGFRSATTEAALG